MNCLPTLAPVSLTLGTDGAIWIFGEMGPQVVLTAFPLNELVDLFHVGAARDAKAQAAHPLRLHPPSSPY